MADIKNQLIKDSYNYVLQSDLSTGVVYRIGGSIPINPIFSSGLTVNSGFTYSNGTEQNGYVLTTDGSGNAYWSEVNRSGGGGGGQLFYLNLSQSQNGNSLLSTTASTASEQTTGVTINNGVTGSIASFQSQSLNITLLPGGIWSFYLHSYKQNTNSSFNIFVEVYKRTSGGTQTLLFSTDPTPVTTNSPNPSMQLTDGYFSGTTLLVSDSIVATVRATNTDNQPHIITLVTEGSTHYSYVVSTIPTQQGISGSGTSNYLPKWSGSTSLVNSLVYDSSTGVTIGTGFTWNNTNSRLGIDILNPTSKLQIKGNGTTNATTTFITQNNSNSVNGTIYDDGTWFFGGSNTRLAAIGGQFDFNSAAGNISRIGHWEMFFRPLQAGSVSLELSTNIRMLNTNVLIGTSTDAGFKLDVNGTSRFVSQITMGNGITGNGNVITTPNSGGGFYGNFFGSVGSPFVYNQTSIFATGGGSVSVTGGSRTSFIDVITWQQSSGNADFSSFRVSPTINQTGTASGITRGLYVNPTISAATDFRAIETTTGNVLFGTGFTWDNTNSRLNVGTNLGAYGVTWIQSDVASTTDYTLVLNNRNTLGVGGESTGIYFANSGYGAASQPYNIGHIVGSIKTLATNFNNVTSRGVMTFNLNNSSSVQEEVMRLVNTTKNVLIGTTTDAGYKLDVNGTSRFSGNLELNAGNNGRIFINNVYPQILFGKTGTPSWSFFVDTENAGQFEIGTGAGFPYNTFSSRIHISTGGNVGIGTIPSYKLDVFGSGTNAGINSNVGLNIQPVAAPIVTSLTYTLQSGSSLGVGTYYYRVTYYNAIGETSASNTIPVITLSGSQVVQLNNIPISTDTTVIGRKIYRSKLTDANSAYGALVGTISNNTGTTYTDSLPDSDAIFTPNLLTRPIYAKANTTSRYISVSGTRAMIADPSLTTFGVNAGASITVAPGVTLMGSGAGQNITYGGGNTLFGVSAGANIVGGFQNVAMGEGAMSSGVVSGSYNIGLGPYVLCRDGSFNIAMGYYTSNSLTGSRNVLIGSYIGSSTSSYNDAIIIGHNATPLSATSYQINIGNTIYGRTNTGNVMIGTTTDAGYKLDVNGSSAFRGRVNIFGEAELRQDGITQIFSSAYGIFQLRGWSTGGLTAYLNAWNYEGYLNFALNVGSSSTANASAVLEVTSTTRGFLPPRMTTTQKNAIASPATGLTVYDNTINETQTYNGSAWITKRNGVEVYQAPLFINTYAAAAGNGNTLLYGSPYPLTTSTNGNIIKINAIFQAKQTAVNTFIRIYASSSPTSITGAIQLGNFTLTAANAAAGLDTIGYDKTFILNNQTGSYQIISVDAFGTNNDVSPQALGIASIGSGVISYPYICVTLNQSAVLHSITINYSR